MYSIVSGKQFKFISEQPNKLIFFIEFGKLFNSNVKQIFNSNSSTLLCKLSIKYWLVQSNFKY